MLNRPEQDSKHDTPKSVTLFGRVIEVIERQPEKALSPILSKPSERETCFR